MSKFQKTSSAYLLAILLAASITQSAQAQTPANFEITQKARNLTKQNFTWADIVKADPGDRLELQIVIGWRGTQATTDVLVGETLGQGLTYAGNLKLDGNTITGNPITTNLNIGTFAANQSKTVTFEATVNPAETFPAGTRTLVSTSTAFNAQGAASDFSRIEVVRGDKPTDVSTGPIGMGVIGFALVLLGAFGAGAFLFLRSYVRREVLESPYDSRTDRKLASMIDTVKERERRG